MKVIGTAGHVDHGKSTLVRALTGMDPDRLAEEKAREMTIDLGFAWLTLPNGEAVGIVDVPGHIDFIKNMLAGVGGIDAALFVIAADEGVMPQTREHLGILDLLQVPAGLVALTKVDLVQGDPDWLELVQADVAAALAGTVLEAAPIVPVSARTGQGLPELVAALQDLLRRVPARVDLGRPRLPVDRVFTIAGFGTIVTGTLSAGKLAVGQEVEIVPAGLRARVRGLQTHKRKLDEAVPGSRVAINLTGVRKEQVSRGDVVCLPGTLAATVLVDVRLRLLPDTPHPLHHNQPVDFFCGAAEVGAHVRLLDSEALAPGAAGWVQLRLDRPVAIQRGDRFIVRQPSPSRTIGGGVVVNPYPGRRWRRFRPEVVRMLEGLHSNDPVQVLEQTLRRNEPTTYAALVAGSGLQQIEARTAFDQLLAARRLVVLDYDWKAAGAGQEFVAPQSVVSAEGWAMWQERITAILTDYHRQFPVRQGIPREELKSRLQSQRRPWSLRLFNDMVTAAASAGVLVDAGAVVHLPGHAVHLAPTQQAALDRLLAQFAANPFTPPSLTEAKDAVGDEVLQWLFDSGQLVRLSDDVAFSTQAYDQLVAGVVEYLSRKGQVTVAEVRDMFNTSRKYALALMEHLDAKRITRRVGDVRVLRGGPTSSH